MFSRLALATAVILAAAGGVIAISGGGSSGGGAAAATANIWVDTNGGSCTRSSTRVAYDDAAACRTFNAANDICRSGDLVIVKNGAYGDMDTTGSNGRTSMCTLQGESKAGVSFHTIETKTSWLTLKDMHSTTGETQHERATGVILAHTSGSHVTYDNVDVTGPWASMAMIGASRRDSDVWWKNSSFGTQGNAKIRLCGGLDDVPVRAANLSDSGIDNVTFWPFLPDTDTVRCGGDTMHLETIRLWDDLDTFTVKNSRFMDGDGSDSYRISSSVGGCGPPTCADNTNLRFINNYFGELCCGHAAPDIGFGDGRPCTGFVFAYNFFKNGPAGLYDNCSTQTGMVYVGNMGRNDGGCPVSGTNVANLWISGGHGSCPGNAWVDAPTPGDWSGYKLAADGMHLTATSPSINAGETTLCARWTGNLDFEGQPRTGNCDAGPDEYVPSR